MVGYAYFRKNAVDMNEEEGIFSDDESKMDMIDRVFKGRMIPLFIIFFCIIIPQIFVQIHNEFLLGKVIFGVYVLMFAVYLIFFVKFAYQYWKVKNRLRN